MDETSSRIDRRIITSPPCRRTCRLWHKQAVAVKGKILLFRNHWREKSYAVLLASFPLSRGQPAGNVPIHRQVKSKDQLTAGLRARHRIVRRNSAAQA